MKKLFLSVLVGIIFGFIGVFVFKKIVVFAGPALINNGLYVEGPAEFNGPGTDTGIGFIMANGKFGIHVSPLSTLHVKGKIRIDPTTPVLSSLPSSYTYKELLPINVDGVVRYLIVYRMPLASDPLLPPSNLTGGVTSVSVQLWWQDNSTTEDSFYIARSVDGFTFVDIGSVGANITTHIDSGLTPSSPYWYRVRACNTVNNICSSFAGNSFMTGATPALPQCSNGVDDDEDTLIDAADSMCHYNNDINDTYIPEWNDEWYSWPSPPSTGGSDPEPPVEPE